VAIYWTTRVIHTTSPPIQRARTTSTHASLVGTARARRRASHHTAGACMDARAGHALSGARLLSAADSAPPPRHDHARRSRSGAGTGALTGSSFARVLLAAACMHRRRPYADACAHAPRSRIPGPTFPAGRCLFAAPSSYPLVVSLFLHSRVSSLPQRGRWQYVNFCFLELYIPICSHQPMQTMTCCNCYIYIKKRTFALHSRYKKVHFTSFVLILKVPILYMPCFAAKYFFFVVFYVMPDKCIAKT
jgi:hypothetical protein